MVLKEYKYSSLYFRGLFRGYNFILASSTRSHSRLNSKFRIWFPGEWFQPNHSPRSHNLKKACEILILVQTDILLCCLLVWLDTTCKVYLHSFEKMVGTTPATQKMQIPEEIKVGQNRCGKNTFQILLYLWYWHLFWIDFKLFVWTIAARLNTIMRILNRKCN